MEVSSSKQEEAAARMELLGMIHSFVTPFVLKAAVQLGIPDILASASEEEGHLLSAEEIMSRIPHSQQAQHLSSSSDRSSSRSGSGSEEEEEGEKRLSVLRRMLNFLATRGVVSASSKGMYGMTPVCGWLVRKRADNLAALLMMETTEACQASWQRLHEVVLHGGDAFGRANGRLFWEDDGGAGFAAAANSAMVAFSSATAAAVVRHYGAAGGFAGISRVVDVGGGLGHSAARIVAAYPRIAAVNFDLPHVVAAAPPIPGVAHVAGDMFVSVPRADAMFIKSVLHNWDDERCGVLLRNCNAALPRNGKLIVVDIVYKPRDRLAQIEANLDMIMVAYTSGGKERTPEEWHRLISAAGFSRIAIRDMPTKESVIEAYKD